ncbi:MAG: hypothetical protein WC547_09885, partial [Candidatus Omnitrophota bacterium]
MYWKNAAGPVRETFPALAARKLTFTNATKEFYGKTIDVLKAMLAMEKDQNTNGLTYWDSEISRVAADQATLQKNLADLSAQLAKDPANESLKRQIAIVKHQITNLDLYLVFVNASKATVQSNINYLSSNGTSETKSAVIDRFESVANKKNAYYTDTVMLLQEMSSSQDLLIAAEITRLEKLRDDSNTRLTKLQAILNPNNTATLAVDDPDNLFKETGIPLSIDGRIALQKKVLDPNSTEKDSKGNIISAYQAKAQATKEKAVFQARIDKENLKPEAERDANQLALWKLEIQKRTVYELDADNNIKKATMYLNTLTLLKQAYIQEAASLQQLIPLITGENGLLNTQKLNQAYFKGSGEQQSALVSRNISSVQQESNYMPAAIQSLNTTLAWMKKTYSDAKALKTSIFQTNLTDINNLIAADQQLQQQLQQQLTGIDAAIAEIEQKISQAEQWLDKLNSKDNNVPDRIMLAQEDRLKDLEKMIRSYGRKLYQSNLLNEAQQVMNGSLAQLRQMGVKDMAISQMTGQGKSRFPVLLDKGTLKKFVDNILSDPQRPQDLVQQQSGELSFANAKSLLGQMGLNLERFAFGEDYCIVTHMSTGTYREMFIGLRNFFGNSPNVKISPFVYTMEADDPDRGASGIGLVMDVTPENRPIYYGLVVDIYKPKYPQQVGYDFAEEKVRMMVTQDYTMAMIPDKNKPGEYRAFVGASLFADMPLGGFFQPKKQEENASATDITVFPDDQYSIGGMLRADLKLTEAFKIKTNVAGGFLKDPFSQTYTAVLGDQELFPEGVQTFSATVEGQTIKYLRERIGLEMDLWNLTKKDAKNPEEFTLEFFVQRDDNTEGDNQTSLGAAIARSMKWKIKNLPIETRIHAEGSVGQQVNEINFDLKNRIKETDVTLRAKAKGDYYAYGLRLARKLFGVDVGVEAVRESDTDGIQYKLDVSDTLRKEKVIGDALGEVAKPIEGITKLVGGLEANTDPLVRSLPFALKNNSRFYETLLSTQKTLSEGLSKWVGAVEARYGGSVDTAQAVSEIQKSFGFDLGINLSIEKRGGSEVDEARALL